MVSVAIDGPAGAGKSTIARAVAEKLGYIYADTGALYRAIGLYAIENGIEPSDAEALKPLLAEIEVELTYRDGEQRILLCGRDVSEAIRRPEMGMAASAVSAIPEVRELLLDMQRCIARRHDVVMDGRDIGTVVLPDADIKIYLTANAEVRAERRHREHIAKGEQVSYNEVLDEIRKRDYNDSHRAFSPLRKADDAILADTSELDLATSVTLVLQMIKDGID